MRCPQPPNSCGHIEFSKVIPLGSLKLVDNGLFPCITPDLDVKCIWFCADQKPLAVARRRVDVRDDLLTLVVLAGLKVKRPKQFRDTQEQIPLRQVNAGTQAASGAISIMISVVGVDALSQLRRQSSDALVVVWVESVGVGKPDGIMMDAPSVEKDDTPFGDLVAIDIVI